MTLLSEHWHAFSRAPRGTFSSHRQMRRFFVRVVRLFLTCTKPTSFAVLVVVPRLHPRAYDEEVSRQKRPSTSASAVSNLEQRVRARAVTEGLDLDEAQLQFLHDACQTITVGNSSDSHRDHTQKKSGVYVHGPAGRGKTWIMSAIYAEINVPNTAKRRVHFHTFFAELQLRFAEYASVREAIEVTARELTDGIRVFFFDELHVHDPGAATLLNRVLDDLVSGAFTVLITSNYEPDKLLDSPLFHELFAPGIAAITSNLEVIELDGGTDYRYGDGASYGVFGTGEWIVVDQSTENRELYSSVGLVEPHDDEATQVLEGHKSLVAKAVRGDEVWFRFTDLFDARSIASDYVEIAQNIATLVITDTPALKDMSIDARTRFVSFIDVLVEYDKRLMIFSGVTKAEFFGDEATASSGMPVDLFRTRSRLALITER